MTDKVKEIVEKYLNGYLTAEEAMNQIVLEVAHVQG